jgi:hypothetical protein
MFVVTAHQQNSLPFCPALWLHIQCDSQELADKVALYLRLFYRVEGERVLEHFPPSVGIVEVTPETPRENMPFCHHEVNQDSYKYDRYAAIDGFYSTKPAVGQPKFKQLNAKEFFAPIDKARRL